MSANTDEVDHLCLYNVGWSDMIIFNYDNISYCQPEFYHIQNKIPDDQYWGVQCLRDLSYAFV